MRDALRILPGMPLDPSPWLQREDCAVVVFECQEGVIGADGNLPGLAGSVASGDVLAHISRLLAGARSARVPVVYCTLRVDEDARPSTTPLELRLRQSRGDDAPERPIDMGPIVAPLRPEPGDTTLERRSGLTGFHRSGLDEALRERGARTVVLVGVSLNIGIPGTAIEAVNHGYVVVVPPDCVAADPAGFAAHALAHQMRQLAFLAPSDAILATWSA